MTPGDLRAFVIAAKQQGATDEFLVAMLRDRGWPTKDIYTVFAQLYSEQTGVMLPAASGRLEVAREAFFHLLAFVTLAAWIFSIGSIWFELIDVSVPDPTTSPLDGFAIGRVSRQLASIIVGFPIFIWATRSILRDQMENPDKAESAVRRWVSNIGLLLTLLVFLGDSITFLTVLLQGEVTARFAFRCCVVLLLSGAVFTYYSRGLGKSRNLPPLTWHRLFAGCAGLAMLLTLVLGFWLNGSPSSVRLLNQDKRRVRDLYNLTLELQNKKLSGMQSPPANLHDIGASDTDPFTRQAYAYHRVDDTRYQLCAHFDAASVNGSSAGARFWAHPAGRKCFDVSFAGQVPYPPNYFERPN
jgi:hypothetical protein